MTQDQVAQVEGMFDAIAGEYDQSGVPFFGPIAAGLVERLAPRRGERIAEMGCGRGACTVPLAEAVGRSGQVDGVDVSEGMLRHGRALLAERGLTWASMTRGDAAAPPFVAGQYDVVAASLVLFFLPDPVAALTRWRELLVPGGRLGVSTFQPWTGVWDELDALREPYVASHQGPQGLDVFQTDEGVEGLFRDAGLTEVSTTAQRFDVPFADFEQWRAWSLAGPGGGLWRGVPEERRPAMAAEFENLLEGYQDSGGVIRLPISARYTLAWHTTLG